MPTYDYACNACGHQFDILQSFNDKTLRKCPKCNKLKLERLISGGAGFIFKGDGFYETDYKKSTKESDSTSDTKSDSSSDSGSTDSTKSDSSSKSDNSSKKDSSSKPKSNSSKSDD